MTTLQTAQRAYDNQAPDDHLDPLDCTQVANWIDSAAHHLMSQRDVLLNGVTIASASELAQLVAASAIAYHQNGLADDYLGRLILSALDFEPGHASGYAIGIFVGNKDHCYDIASDMLEPFAQQILDQINEENSDEDAQ